VVSVVSAPSAPSVLHPPVLERERRSEGRLITERLYDCGDGWSVAARRGGPLDLADDDSWEVVVLMGAVVYGAAAGFVTEQELAWAVDRTRELVDMRVGGLR
jgi:hypothetical protein